LFFFVGDFDNDGDSDIIISGASPDIESITKIYVNEGNGSFAESAMVFAGVSSGSVNWGDYNNDGRLDILLTGDNYTDPWNHYYITKICRNVGLVSNNTPQAPSNLVASLEGLNVGLSWDPGSDIQTPVPGLSYNLKLGTATGSIDLISPMSDTDGFRFVASRGPVNSNCATSFPLSMLNETDTYYWSCQTIDAALCGSSFSTESKFRLSQSIDLLSESQLNFGQILLGGASDTLEVVIKNYGLQNLTVSNVCLGNTTSPFHFNYPNLRSLIGPADIDTIFVSYSPSIIGVESDTLYIYSDADNEPLIKIRLTGTGEYVPPAPPANVNIVMNGYDAVISWDAVTQNTHGTPIEPDYYFVWFNGSPDIDDDYYFLAPVTGTTYTHVGVALGAQHMFYQVTAVKFYRDDIPNLNAWIDQHLHTGLAKHDIQMMLLEWR
jgi:hypothetical protein